VTGDALADTGKGSARTSGETSDEGEATGGMRIAEVGREMGEGADGRILPLDFFSLARLFWNQTYDNRTGEKRVSGWFGHKRAQ
jgi:hypothetical protein